MAEQLPPDDLWAEGMSAIQFGNAAIRQGQSRTGSVEATRESLRPLTVGLGVLYGGLALGHALLLHEDIASTLALSALLTAVLLFGFYILLRRQPLPVAWVSPFGAIIAGLVLANTLLHLYLTEQPEQTAYLMLLLLVAAFFLPSLIWLGLIVALTWAGWALVVWSAHLTHDVKRWLVGLLAATVLTMIVHLSRSRALGQFAVSQPAGLPEKGDAGRGSTDWLGGEERFRRLASVALEALIIYDRNTILAINRPLAQLLGYETDSLVGKSVFDLVAPEMRALARERLNRPGLVSLEVTLVRRDGTRFPAEVRCKNWPYAGRSARVMSVRDLSEQKVTERALRRAREYAEMIYRVVPTPIFTVDRHGTITSLNEKTVHLLGYSAEELIGQPCSLISRADCQAQCGLCPGSDLTLGPLRGIEGTVRTKSGETRTVIKNLELLTDPTGQVIGGIESLVDITEHRRVEEQLRKLSGAVEQSPSVVIITDTNGTIEYVNPRFTAVTGYSAEEVIGQRPSILKSGHTSPAEYEELWETITSGGEWRGEFLNKKKNGELYWEFATILPIKDAEGRITHFLGVKEDITARKQAEQALQESLFRTQVLYNASHTLLAAQSLPELFQAIVDNVAAALYADRVVMVMLDHDLSTILHFVAGGPGAHFVEQPTLDELWDGLTGWVLREGKPALSPKDEPDPREAPAIQQRRLETNCGDIIVVPLTFHDGTVGTLTAINLPSGRSFTYQDLELMMALTNQSVIAIDNARLVDSLRQSEEKFSRAFRASPDAMMISTLYEGRFVDVNDSFLEMVGYGHGEVIGRTLDEVNVWPEQEERHMIINAVVEEGAVRNVEVTFRRKSGETGIALLSAEVVELDGVPCVLTIAKDITERIQAAQEREQLIQELDAFARTVAHDLKSPLSPILGYSELLLDEKSELSPEMRRSFVQMIADSARRMGNIIDELLLLARMRQSELQTHPLDMAAIVADALGRLAYLINEYEADIVVADAWPPALGYAPWVVEVWVNYISNALKYGGNPPRVELGADVLPDGTPRFWVRDNGAGLTAEQEALLFTPFTQLSNGHVEGHGLGLSIVQRIVERLAGEVGVESEPGQGSLFYFTLP
ncbi:MAG: PAS domain-containing sensor histidine kinase, partial [Aggregatilineaceae bacterium]